MPRQGPKLASMTFPHILYISKKYGKILKNTRRCVEFTYYFQKFWLPFTISMDFLVIIQKIKKNIKL
eukprot:c38925_g1_i1 orf=3-200(-)